MGVYIKGMAMPKSCLQCPFRKFWDVEDQCLAKKNLWVKGNEIPPVCPLVEVKTHGRLIDADALHIQLIDKELDQLQPWTLFDDYREVVQMIDDAPTIIESEE